MSTMTLSQWGAYWVTLSKEERDNLLYESHKQGRSCVAIVSEQRELQEQFDKEEETTKNKLGYPTCWK